MMGPTSRAGVAGKFPAGRLRLGPSAWDGDVVYVRDRTRRGYPEEARPTVERLMDRFGALGPPEVLLAYAEYLLGRGRPFSAGRALWPLVQQDESDPRARVLYAEALAGAGNLEKAVSVVEQIANGGGPAAVDAAATFDALYRLKSAAGDTAALEPRRKELFRLTGRELEDLLAPGSPSQVDRWIEQKIASGQEAGSADTWALYLGSFLVRHGKGEWRWRRRLGESTVVMTRPGGSLELTPSIWAGWRLQGGGRRFGRLLAVMLELGAVERSAVRNLSGEYAAVGGTVDPTDSEVEDALSLALDEALRRSRQGQSIDALGVTADTPVATLRVPLLVSSDARGPMMVLFREREAAVEPFARSLDLFCLSRFAQQRWVLVGSTGLPAEEVPLYESGDGGVRATLAARRLCTEDPAANARWAATLAQVCFNRLLDGRPESLIDAERLIWDEIRPGGRLRWGALFEDRFALLLLLTCYSGEVLRAHYGGRWGGDRLTGRTLGPTAGLELSDLRFNLGAKVLSSFYHGPDRPFAPMAAEFAWRAEASSAAASVG